MFERARTLRFLRARAGRLERHPLPVPACPTACAMALASSIRVSTSVRRSVRRAVTCSASARPMWLPGSPAPAHLDGRCVPCGRDDTQQAWRPAGCCERGNGARRGCDPPCALSLALGWVAAYSSEVACVVLVLAASSRSLGRWGRDLKISRARHPAISSSSPSSRLLSLRLPFSRVD